MDEKSEDGVILGAIYTTEDTPINQSEKEVAANFDDGTFINVNKETQTLTISFPNINIVGNITQDGTLANTNGITSQADVADATSTMQEMRDIYNPHTHVGNMGSPTSTPNKGM
jgi:phage baseplate assembly protein gpV